MYSNKMKVIVSEMNKFVRKMKKQSQAEFLRELNRWIKKAENLLYWQQPAPIVWTIEEEKDYVEFRYDDMLYQVIFGYTLAGDFGDRAGLGKEFHEFLGKYEWEYMVPSVIRVFFH